MNVAYDTQLEVVVTASEASNYSVKEPYRYECMCCGEIVSIAAADSYEKATHFRHKHGNNNKNCELYCGSYGNTFGKGAKDGSIEAYFDGVQKNFQVGISFSEQAILEHERESSSLKLARKGCAENPFYVEKVSRSTFIPNEQKRIIIQQFSQEYLLSNDTQRRNKIIKCFNDWDELTVFKVLGDCKDNFRARLIKGDTLYTGVQYFAVSYSDSGSGRYVIPSTATVETEFEFNTMGRKFKGTVLTLNDTCAESLRWCRLAGYRLAKAESFDILWPPVFETDESFISNKREVIVYSSFELRGRGNISLSAQYIECIGDNCYKLTLCERAKVMYKNTEVRIEYRQSNEPFAGTKNEILYADKMIPQMEYQNMFFSDEGVLELPSNVPFLLFGNRVVKCYKSNYVQQEFNPTPIIEKSKTEVVEEVKKVYFATEEFGSSIFRHTSTSFADEFISASRGKGVINLAIKRLIDEGEL